MTEEKVYTESELRAMRPPDSVVAELNEFAEATGYKIEKIKSMYYDVLVQPYMDQLSIDDRLTQASKVVKAQLLDLLSFKTSLMEFSVLDKSGIKNIEKFVTEEDPKTGQQIKVKKIKHLGKVFVLAAGAGESDLGVKLGIITFWDDACQKMDELIPGKAYRAEMGLSEYENYYDLSALESTTFENIQIDLPPASEIIEQMFSPIDVCEAKFNLSGDDYDFKLIKGEVQSSRTNISRKGKNLGYLNIYDSRFPLNEVNTNPDAKVLVMFSDSPEMVKKYMSGSTVYVLTTISQDDDYGLSMWGQLIIPLKPIINPQFLPRSNQTKIQSDSAKPADDVPTAANARW